MSSQSSSGTCLVARAAPCTIPQEPSTERITDALRGLSIKEAPVKQKKHARNVDGISPSDYVSLQSLRSSALARKTNTTSKFVRDGANLFSDLLDGESPAPKIEEIKVIKQEPVEEIPMKKKEESKNEKSKAVAEKEEKEKKKVAEKSEAKNSAGVQDEKEVQVKEEPKSDGEDESELLSRGPVRTSRQTAYTSSHPYGNNRYAYAGQPNEYPNYNNPYETECQNWWNSENSGYSPQSDAGYYSPQRHSPFTADHGLSSAELSRLLSAKQDEEELPDALSDFILKYSRRYSSSAPDTGENRLRKNSFNDSTAGSPSHQRPPSTDSGCGSPMSAGSAPQRSPAAPRGGICCPMTPLSDPRYQSQTGELYRPAVRPESGARLAKTRLRSMISDTDMDVAWAWTCKCVQYIPGALYYQDPDRDTLLHIVIAHLDIPKVYALVEQMLKMEFPPCQKPFDTPNSSNETPLFLAVENRRAELVDYLAEAGADPNIQTSRPERDAPLHYAAARGMTSIVQILCSYSSTNIDLSNGMGLTPLLCAVKNHGVMEEQSQCVLDNKSTIRVLLEAGADPTIADATNGKTVIHYAAERLDAELVEIFREVLDENKMSLLVNQPDLSRETPIESLPASSNSQLRSNIFVALVSCGATIRRKMSVNTANTPDGAGVLIYNGEMILLYTKVVSLSFSDSPGEWFKGKHNGNLYLTSHRIIFVNGRHDGPLRSFSMPFHCLRNVKLEQPVFGANYLKGVAISQPGGIWSGEVVWKLSFAKGGCIDFGQALLKAADMAHRFRPYDAPPAYAPPPSNFYSAPPAYYIPQNGMYNGFQAPTNVFPDQPPAGNVFMFEQPPPYGGIGPDHPPYPAGTLIGGQQPSGPPAPSAPPAYDQATALPQKA